MVRMTLASNLHPFRQRTYAQEYPRPGARDKKIDRASIVLELLNVQEWYPQGVEACSEIIHQLPNRRRICTRRVNNLPSTESFEKDIP